MYGLYEFYDTQENPLHFNIYNIIIGLVKCQIIYVYELWFLGTFDHNVCNYGIVYYLISFCSMSNKMPLY